MLSASQALDRATAACSEMKSAIVQRMCTVVQGADLPQKEAIQLSIDFLAAISADNAETYWNRLLDAYPEIAKAAKWRLKFLSKGPTVLAAIRAVNDKEISEADAGVSEFIETFKQAREVSLIGADKAIAETFFAGAPALEH